MTERAPLITFQLGQLIRRRTVSSIDELASEMKMSENAVRNHLKDLMRAGLVTCDTTQKKYLYALDPKCAYVVGVEVGRNSAVAAVCDMRLNPCGEPETHEVPAF